MSDEIRTLRALVLDVKLRVRVDCRQHTTCNDALQNVRASILEELAPSTDAFYARIPATRSVVPVAVMTVQLAQLVTINSKRYALDDLTQPPPAVLFVAQHDVKFYVKYARPQDKFALPPFHLNTDDGQNDWYSVCLGASYDPTKSTLATLLEVANLSDTYVNLLSLAERLGTKDLPTPFDAWAVAMANLEAGVPVRGFRRVEEIHI